MADDRTCIHCNTPLGEDRPYAKLCTPCQDIRRRGNTKASGVKGNPGNKKKKGKRLAGKKGKFASMDLTLLLIK